MKITLEDDYFKVAVENKEAVGLNDTWVTAFGDFVQALHGMGFTYLPDAEVVKDNIKEFMESLSDE